jgi:predicted NBD/HSP70 family sugar kinase
MNDATTRAGDRSQFTILVIDIGGTHIKFGYVSEGQPQSFSHFVPTQRLREANPVERLASETKQAIDLYGAVPDIVVCTVPGFLAKDGDLVLHLPNLREMDGHCLKTDLAAQLGLPVVLERDSNLALLGESLAGAARDAGAVLGMFFGTGIGASLIVDGTPFRGSGWALELGHAPVFGEHIGDTELKHPTIEDYASGRALQAIASRHQAPIRDVFEMGRRNVSLGAELDRFVRYQALAVSSAIATLSPETVVLGGGVPDIDGYPRHRLEELIAANALCMNIGLSLDLRWATLGWGSVLYGAPQIVRQHAAHRLVP